MITGPFQNDVAGASFIDSLAGQRRSMPLLGFTSHEREIPLAFDAGGIYDPNNGVADFRSDAVAADDCDLVHL
jgi:hypothetical protein